MNKITLIFLTAVASLSATGAFNWQDVEERTKNAVVQIHAYGDSTNPLEPFNKKNDDKKWTGSGFFIDEEGYFLTNYHVAGNTKRIEISMPSIGRDRFAAELVGCKPERDIALCRLTNLGKTKFEKFLKNKVAGTNGVIPFLPLADENRLHPVQEIMALGYPHADGFKRTVGHINGVSAENGAIYCQISAPINPGNSGGPTVDHHGRVIGVNTSKRTDSDATGYMSPVHTFRHLVDDMRHHRVLHTDFGMRYQSTTNNIIEASQCPATGVLITHVPDDCFGDKAGFKTGDIMMSLNGNQIDNDGLISTDWIDAKVPLIDVMDHLPVGAPLEATMWRDGKAVTLTSTMPAYAVPTISHNFPELGHLACRSLGGIVVQPLRFNHMQLAYNEAKRSLNAPLYTLLNNNKNLMKQRLIISRVFDGTQAEHEHALNTGTVIDKINGEKVRTLADLDKQIATTKGDFIIIETVGNNIASLHIPTLIAEDEFLREQHRYDEAPGVTALRTR